MMTIRRLVLLITLLGALLTCLGGSCQQPATVPHGTEADLALDGLNQDITVLSTLNRLDLKAEQIKQLLAVMAAMNDDVQKLEAQRQAALGQLIPLLREKRMALLADKEPAEELEGKLQAAQEKLDDLSAGAGEARSKHAGDLKKVLSQAQLDIITGADEAAAQASELLDWIRDMTEAEFAEEGKANAAELADPEAGLTADAVLKIFAEARKMSNADYQKNRAGLVSRLAKLYMPMPEAADDSLVEWFGNARLGTLLQERLDLLGAK